MEISTLADAPAARPSPIYAVDVPDRLRPGFLPRRFGPKLMLRAELMLYSWMGRLSADYTGGLWRFVDLSNDGFYLAPHLATPLRLRWGDNGFDGTVSPDAAGIVATLFTLSHLTFEGHEALSDPYHLLVDYAVSHPEHALILRAID